MAAIDEFIAGLEEIEPEVPQTVTWNGTEYPCFASGATRGGKLEHFGFGVDDDLVIILRGELFQDGNGNPTATPLKGQMVIFRTIEFRIDRVLTAPASAFLRLTLVNASRGS